MEIRRSGYYCLIAGAALAMPAAHSETGYEFRVGAAQTDNFLRGDADEQDETIGIVGATLDVSGDSKRFSGSLIGDISWQHYQSGEYDDEVRPDLHGLLEWKIASDTLKWIVEDRFGQVTSDPFGVDSVLNREYVNRLETGPDLLLNLAGNTGLAISGRLIDTKFEVSDSDSRSLTANAGLVRALSRHRQLSLHVQGESIDFDDPAFRDFDRRAAFLQFESEVPRGTIKLIGGVNEVEFEDETIDGPLVDVDISRKLGDSVSLNLGYWRGLTDASDQFGRSSAEVSDPSGGEPINVFADTYETEQVSVSIGRSRENSSFSIGYYRAEDDYATASEYDSLRDGFTLGFEYRFASGWRFGVNGFTETRDFSGAGLDDENFELNVELGRRLTRTLSLSLAYLRADRDSGSPTNTYTENRYSLSLQFRPRADSETKQPDSSSNE